MGPESSLVRTFEYRGCRVVLQAVADVEYTRRFRANWTIVRDETRVSEGSTVGTFATAEQALLSADSLARGDVDSMLPRS